MKSLRESFFGKETKISAVCEIFPIEIHIQFVKCEKPPQNYRVEIQDTLYQSTVFKTIAHPINPYKNTSNLIILNVPRQILQVQLTKKNEYYKSRYLEISVFKFTSVFGKIKTPDILLGSYTHDISRCLNLITLAKIASRISFKINHKNVKNIECNIQIIIYLKSKLNPRSSTMVEDSIRNEKKSFLRHSLTLKSFFTSKKNNIKNNSSIKTNFNQSNKIYHSGNIKDEEILVKCIKIIGDYNGFKSLDIKEYYSDGVAFMAIIYRYLRIKAFDQIYNYSIDERYEMINQFCKRYEIPFDIKSSDFSNFSREYLKKKIIANLKNIFEFFETNQNKIQQYTYENCLEYNCNDSKSNTFLKNDRLKSKIVSKNTMILLQYISSSKYFLQNNFQKKFALEISNKWNEYFYSSNFLWIQNVPLMSKNIQINDQNNETNILKKCQSIIHKINILRVDILTKTKDSKNKKKFNNEISNEDYFEMIQMPFVLKIVNQDYKILIYKYHQTLQNYNYFESLFLFESIFRELCEYLEDLGMFYKNDEMVKKVILNSKIKLLRSKIDAFQSNKEYRLKSADEIYSKINKLNQLVYYQSSNIIEPELIFKFR